MKVHIYIYAIARNGETLYVGQTINPTTRHAQHRSSNRDRFSGSTFEIIGRCVSPSFATQKESAAIRRFKKIGQCKFNKIIPTSAPVSRKGSEVWFEGEKYSSAAALGRAIKHGRKWMRDNGIIPRRPNMIY